jgi:hypothetical protein
MYCYACRKAGPDIDGKTEFVTGKKFKRESLVYHNKTKSQKHENCSPSVLHQAGYLCNQLIQPVYFLREGFVFC